LKALLYRIGQPGAFCRLGIVHAQFAADRNRAGRILFDVQHITVVQPIGVRRRAARRQAVKGKLPLFARFKIVQPERADRLPIKALIVQQPRTVGRDLDRRQPGADFHLRAVLINDLHFVGQKAAVQLSVVRIDKHGAVSQRAHTLFRAALQSRKLRGQPLRLLQRGGKLALQHGNAVGQRRIFDLCVLQNALFPAHLLPQGGVRLALYGKLQLERLLRRFRSGRLERHIRQLRRIRAGAERQQCAKQNCS